jgi:CcmD family protein
MTIEVTATILIIWLGIALFIYRLDKKVKKLEEESREE